MVIVLNRFDECLDFVTHVAYVDDGRLACVKRADEQAYASFTSSSISRRAISRSLQSTRRRNCRRSTPTPLVQLTGATVRYTDNTVFEGLDRTIEPNQSWQLSGPNGSGKTCLLQLITGDHPQCYVNDINIFGYQRGTGESIWEIKLTIGYVSTALSGA